MNQDLTYIWFSWTLLLPNDCGTQNARQPDTRRRHKCLQGNIYQQRGVMEDFPKHVYQRSAFDFL